MNIQLHNVLFHVDRNVQQSSKNAPIYTVYTLHTCSSECESSVMVGVSLLVNVNGRLETRHQVTHVGSKVTRVY